MDRTETLNLDDLAKRLDQGRAELVKLMALVTEAEDEQVAALTAAHANPNRATIADLMNANDRVARITKLMKTLAEALDIAAATLRAAGRDVPPMEQDSPKEELAMLN